MTQNADYVCRYCGEPVTVRENGEWGHRALSAEVPTLRFWCHGNRVAPNLTVRDP